MDDIEVWDVEIEDAEIRGIEVKIEKWKSAYQSPKPETMFVGIDPGTSKLGIAVINETTINLFQVDIDRPKNPITRMKLMREIFAKCVNSYKYNTVLVIEGSAFSKAYREAELSEVRATAVWWGLGNGFDVFMFQPNTIRKVVFGNGKTKAQDAWKSLPPDAANALACAWYGAKK